MKSFIELFRILHESQLAAAEMSSKIVRENGVSQFWVKRFVRLGDSRTSLETYVYRMQDNTGLVTIYRPVSGKRMDVETINLSEIAAI